MRTMKALSSFPAEFQAFVHEEARREAQGILQEKDNPRASFTLQDMKNFSYTEQLAKFQRTNPILVAVITGTMSHCKGEKPEHISRKGFGGARRGEDIDLTPTLAQTISRVLRNRHSSSISLIPCLNSLHLWGNRVPGNLFNFFNSIGDSYRCGSFYSLNLLFDSK